MLVRHSLHSLVRLHIVAQVANIRDRGRGEVQEILNIHEIQILSRQPVKSNFWTELGIVHNDRCAPKHCVHNMSICLHLGISVT